MRTASGSSSRVARERRLQKLDEKPQPDEHWAEIDVAMLYIEEARRRAERAVAALRSDDADAHLVAALERSEKELSDVARRLRQGTFFATPNEQVTV